MKWVDLPQEVAMAVEDLEEPMDNLVDSSTVEPEVKEEEGKVESGPSATHGGVGGSGNRDAQSGSWR